MAWLSNATRERSRRDNTAADPAALTLRQEEEATPEIVSLRVV